MSDYHEDYEGEELHEEWEEDEDRLPTPPLEVEAEEAQTAIAADNLTAEERAQVNEMDIEPDDLFFPEEPTLEEADKARVIQSLGLREPDAQLLVGNEYGPGIVRPQVAQYQEDNGARLRAQVQDPDLMKLKT